jgi:hypothetical protein
MSTEMVGYRTGYKPPTNTRGARIKVENLMTGASKLVPFEHAIGGGLAQHEHAVQQAAAGTIVRVDRIGDWKMGEYYGYYFSVEREEQ